MFGFATLSHPTAYVIVLVEEEDLNVKELDAEIEQLQNKGYLTQLYWSKPKNKAVRKVGKTYQELQIPKEQLLQWIWLV